MGLGVSWIEKVRKRVQAKNKGKYYIGQDVWPETRQTR